MNMLRKFALRVGRPNAPHPHVAFRFISPVRDSDLACFDVNESSPPPSDWPFARLRELGITQCDDYFAILDDEVGDAFSAAVWILPLQDFQDGMLPVTIWRGGPFAGIAVCLQSPNFPSARWYLRKRVDIFINTVAAFEKELSTRAELRYEALPTEMVALRTRVQHELADWIVD